MNIRREAILAGAEYYSGTCANNPSHRRRWTGSGACADCHPKRRGTLITAMTALYGPARISLEYARSVGLPLFRAVCDAQGHNTWRYVKTPHVCPQCEALARSKRGVAPTRPARIKREAPPPRKLYFVVDLRSGLIVSYIGYSRSTMTRMRKEIKRDHPGMLPILYVRTVKPRTLQEIRNMSMLRLDRYPTTPDWPEEVL